MPHKKNYLKTVSSLLNIFLAKKKLNWKDDYLKKTWNLIKLHNQVQTDSFTGILNNSFFEIFQKFHRKTSEMSPILRRVANLDQVHRIDFIEVVV